MRKLSKSSVVYGISHSTYLIVIYKICSQPNDVTHKCELNLPKVNDIIKTDSVKKIVNAVVFYYCVYYLFN